MAPGAWWAMVHGAIYNAGRLGCVAGWFAAIQALTPLPALQWAPLERRCVVGPLMLACLVTLLHTPYMTSHHPDTRAKLGFVERVTYYASIQAAALLLLVHFSESEPEPEQPLLSPHCPPAGLVALYMIYDMGHHVRHWGACECTVLPSWLLGAVTWTYVLFCVYAGGPTAVWTHHMSATLLADLSHVVFIGLYERGHLAD